MLSQAVLTNQQMSDADRSAVDAGVASLDLMEAAGQAVASQAMATAGRTGTAVILCGPGNNGGDGYVAARHLAGLGWRLRLYTLCDRKDLKGDAAAMAGRFGGAIAPLESLDLTAADVIIDALFGAGLARPLAGPAAAAVEAANRSGLPIVAVDVPSGLDGDTGTAGGPVIKARDTVTFFRRKPAHLLYPGRALCGRVHVVDIGIPDHVLAEIKPMTFANQPPLWRHSFAWPSAQSHKYQRGHSVIVSGGRETTGAARLAARGALRAGAGLVTVASPVDAVDVNAAHLTAIMLRSFANRAGLADILSDRRKNAVLIGPGRGTGDETASEAELVLATAASVVLDADALTSFADRAGKLQQAISAKDQGHVVITPHDGEFARLFPNAEGCRLQRARDAAANLGAVVVLKGADSVIAHPDGRAGINANAPPDLATAGSGDVLAGLITGLLASGMPPFEAAAAAVWLHGEAAARFGPGLIAEDLPEMVPLVLRDLKAAG